MPLPNQRRRALTISLAGHVSREYHYRISFITRPHTQDVESCSV